MRILIRVALVAFLIVDLNIIAAQFLSELQASELSQSKSAVVHKNVPYAYEYVIQNPAVGSGTKENLKQVKSETNQDQGRKLKSEEKASPLSVKNWNTNLQPYIDAHRKFWVSQSNYIDLATTLILTFYT